MRAKTLTSRPRSPSASACRRYIATVVTAQHHAFQFLELGNHPRQTTHEHLVIASRDARSAGRVVQSLHAQWALVTVPLDEDRPRRVIETLYLFRETFPFPDEDTGLTPELRAKIASLAEQIDAHRKRALGQLPSEPPATQNSLKVGQPGSVGSDLASAATWPATLPGRPAPCPPCWPPAPHAD